MDPLKELYELYDQMNVQPKPDLSPDPTAMMGTPGGSMMSDPKSEVSQEYIHPVLQQRLAIDQMRQQGMPIEIAHQHVKGQVDLGDIQSKADLATTFGRQQDDGMDRHIRPDANPEHMSLLAKEFEYEKSMDSVTPQDLKTPMPSEVPDQLQNPVSEEVDNQGEDWYNFDVSYIQQFGR